jgi:hypothetical protein
MAHPLCFTTFCVRAEQLENLFHKDAVKTWGIWTAALCRFYAVDNLFPHLPLRCFASLYMFDSEGNSSCIVAEKKFKVKCTNS